MKLIEDMKEQLAEYGRLSGINPVTGIRGCFKDSRWGL